MPTACITFRMGSCAGRNQSCQILTRSWLLEFQVAENRHLLLTGAHQAYNCKFRWSASYSLYLEGPWLGLSWIAHSQDYTHIVKLSRSVAEIWHFAILCSANIWHLVAMEAHFPRLRYWFDKSTITSKKYQIQPFEKCLLEPVYLNNAKLTENEIQLFYQNTSFLWFERSVCYDLDRKESRSYRHCIAHSWIHTGT